MAKVRLLNDGCYGDSKNVDFPVIVEGVEYGVVEAGSILGFDVMGCELERVGFTCVDVDDYYFSLGSECELIEEAENEG